MDDFLGELDDVKACWGLLWSIGGDFNLVKFLSERKCMARLDPKMAKYRAFIDRRCLIDSPLKGTKFTWYNFQDPPS